MVQGVQFRRGTTSQHSVFTGQPGEITVDTDKKVVVVHDGSAVGGYEVVGAGTTQRITNKDVNATSLNVTGVSTIPVITATHLNVSGITTLGYTTTTSFNAQSINVSSASTVGLLTATSIGIGTANSTSKLSVQGDSLIVGVVTANSFRARGGAPGAIGINNNGYGFFGSGDNDSGLYSSADGQLEFYNNSQESARFTSNQNLLINRTSETGIANQRLQVNGGASFTGIGSNVGIGTSNPADTLTVLGKVHILNDSTGNSRLILRAKPGNLYRWNFDNDANTNALRIFKEDDGTAANGAVAIQVDQTGNTLISGITTTTLGSSSSPPNNSQMSFALTSNTNLRISVRGTDGVLRTANITLA